MLAGVGDGLDKLRLAFAELALGARADEVEVNAARDDGGEESLGVIGNENEQGVLRWFL